MKDHLANSVQNSESEGKSSTGPTSSRIMLVVVIVMGVMIVLGSILLVWVIAHRMLHPHKPLLATGQPSVVSASVEATVPVDMVAQLAVSLREGEHILSVTPRHDGMLAVTVGRADGQARILLWFPEQERLVAELDLNH